MHYHLPLPSTLRANTHVADAKLWTFVESQEILTVEDIAIYTERGTHYVSVCFFGDEPTPSKFAAFAQAFALCFAF